MRRIRLCGRFPYRPTIGGYERWRPGFFYARWARNQVDRRRQPRQDQYGVGRQWEPAPCRRGAVQDDGRRAARNAADRSCAPYHVVKLKRTMWSSGATLLALLLVFVRPALGDPCVLTVGSLYQLKSDAVDWTMQTSSGQSCIRGLRHKRVTIDTAKLISPPQSGQVKLLGPGFSYTAKSDFEGQDSFTIQVSGMLNGI